MKKTVNNKAKKRILLSLAALILVMMIALGVTYSWIEDNKLVSITTTNVDGDNIPLKTGVDINSTVEITANNETINLGYMLKDSDLKNNDGTFKSNISADTVNKNKGYFYESGDMHLSPCYSNGTSFYFPVLDTNGDPVSSTTRYRLGNKDDANVNYIDFTFNVYSPDQNIAFWFDSIPTIKAGNTDIEKARVAITVDGNTKVLCKTGTDVNTVNSLSASQTTSVDNAEPFSKYTYNDENNNPSVGGKNGNVLFSVAKNTTKTVNVKIWVESGATDVSSADIDMVLVSSLSKRRNITLVDKTTSITSSSWLGGSGVSLYLVIPQAYKDNNNTWTEGTSYWKLTESNGTFSPANIPAYYNNCRMFIFRCPANTFRDISQTRPDGINDDYKYAATEGATATYHGLPFERDTANYNNLDGTPQIWAWNYWSSVLPNTFADETYTVYGGTLDTNAVGRCNNQGLHLVTTFKGYGTWGETVEINIQNGSGSTCAPYKKKTYNDITTYANMFVFDYSDYATTNEIYRYTMYFKKTNPSSGDYGTWKVNLPVSSTLIQFYYDWEWTDDNETWRDFWGYHTSANGKSIDNNVNIPVRPATSTTYYIQGSPGSGSWADASGTGKVYLVRNGNMLDHHPYADVYNTNDDKADLTKMTENRKVKIDGTEYKVYEVSAETKYSNIKFRSYSNSVSSMEQTLSGHWDMYYNYADNTWYSSLNDIPGYGDSSEALSTTTSGNGWYVYGILDGSGTSKYLKLASSDSGVVYLNQAERGAYHFKLVNVSGSTTTSYGITNSDYRVLNGSNTGTQEYYMVKNYSNDLSLQVNTAAYYKFQRVHNNSTTETIKITYDSAG